MGEGWWTSAGWVSICGYGVEVGMWGSSARTRPVLDAVEDAFERGLRDRESRTMSVSIGQGRTA